MADVTLVSRDRGNTILFCPETDAARQWLWDHTVFSYWRGRPRKHGMPVPHVYAADLRDAMSAAGFILEES